jgi:maleate isomerase
MDGFTDPVRFRADLATVQRHAHVGLIVLSTDEVGESAFTEQMPSGVQVLTTRGVSDPEVHRTGRFELRGGFGGVASTLPPAERLDLIAFSCTSGTVASGDEAVQAAFSAALPGVPMTNPAIAAVAAFRARGVSRLAMLTPYPADVHALFPAYFSKAGFDIVSHGTFGAQSDAEISAIGYSSILDAGRHLIAGAGADALFLSCTAFNVVNRLPQLRAELGLPVFSSSQAFAWHALSLLSERFPELKREAEARLDLAA